MGTFLDQVPEAVQEHIRKITKTSGLSDTDESTEKIAEAWLEKKKRFEQRIEENDMTEIDEFDAEEERGALFLTYSGSLLTIGPGESGLRSVDYTSIGLRQDVPESAHAEETKLSGEASVDSIAEFTNGPIKKSSAIYAIAINPEDLSNEEEDELLAAVTQLLADDFVEVNKTILVP